MEGNRGKKRRKRKRKKEKEMKSNAVSKRTAPGSHEVILASIADGLFIQSSAGPSLLCHCSHSLCTLDRRHIIARGSSTWSRV